MQTYNEIAQGFSYGVLIVSFCSLIVERSAKPVITMIKAKTLTDVEAERILIFSILYTLISVFVVLAIIFDSQVN